MEGALWGMGLCGEIGLWREHAVGSSRFTHLRVAWVAVEVGETEHLVGVIDVRLIPATRGEREEGRVCEVVEQGALWGIGLRGRGAVGKARCGERDAVGKGTL